MINGPGKPYSLLEVLDKEASHEDGVSDGNSQGRSVWYKSQKLSGFTAVRETWAL